MDTFVAYDFFRLSEYKKRKPQINFGTENNVSYTMYDEVNYFNYIFLSSPDASNVELSELLSKYMCQQKNKVKIIIPLTFLDEYTHLYDNEISHKEIACVQRHVVQNEIVQNDEKNLDKVNTLNKLKLFTEIYLTCFESSATVDDVLPNFEFLMHSEKTDLFLIIHNEEAVGICVNYYHEKHVVLSACGVLQEHRNKGFQKKAINARIAAGAAKGYSSFTAWCYNSSVSHQNMLKSNFINYSFYAECVSKPLEYIINSKAVLH